MKKIIIGIILMMVLIIPTYAEEYPKNTMFKLTYPDGSTYETEDYSKIEGLLDEWKKLYSDVTNENGEIKLNGWQEEGNIKIVEVKVPEGYEVDNTETITNLKNKEITIINKKKAEKEEEVVEPTIPPKEEDKEDVVPPLEEEKEEIVLTPPKKEVKNEVEVPKTLDNIITYVILFVVSIGIVVVLILYIKEINKNKK